MRVPRRSLHLCVTENPPHHWQALAAHYSLRCERVTEIVNSPIFQAGAATDTLPRPLKAGR